MDNQRIGLAGELRVMSELLLRGYNPAKSYLDNGVDLILENGLRIQVKTSQNRSSNGRDSRGSYIFCTRKGNDKKNIHLSAYVDFLICWAIPEDKFWIIPATVISDKSSVNITFLKKRPNNLYERFEGNWELLERR